MSSVAKSSTINTSEQQQNQSMLWPTLLNLANTGDNIQEDGDSNTDTDNKEMCKYVINKKDQLGDGQFSIVQECMNIKTKKKFAMKLIHKKLIIDKLRLIQREVGILRKLRNQVIKIEKENLLKYSKYDEEVEYLFKGHHHVLQLFDFFETKKHIVLITQLCDRGDLYDYIISNGHLDLTKTVKPYTACILSGLKFLHDSGIVHRDIKAENILFRVSKNSSSNSGGGTSNPIESSSRYDLKSHDLIIADFGLATIVQEIEGGTNKECDTTQNVELKKNELKEFVGTLSYISPEIVVCKNCKNLAYEELIKIPSYDYKVDIWALGVLSYFMKFGYMPFDCENDTETLQCITDGDYYMETEEDGTEKKLIKEDEKEFIDFLEKCFTLNFQERPSSTDLLAHPFVNQFFHDTDVQQENVLSNLPPISFLKKTKSSSSIRMRKVPSRTSSSSSITSLNSVGSGGNTHTNKHSNSSSNILMNIAPHLTMNKSMHSLTTLSNINNNGKAAIHSNNNLMCSHLNSTFKLEPDISENYLMVGSYCDSPSVHSGITSSSSTTNMSKENSTNALNSGVGYQPMTSYFMPTSSTSISSLNLDSSMDFSNQKQKQKLVKGDGETTQQPKFFI